MRAARSTTVFVFIDPTIADPTAQDPCVLEALAGGTVARVELPRIHDDIDPDLAPYLIHVSDEPRAERVVNATFALAASEALNGVDRDDNGRSVCAWLIGDWPPRALADRLAAAARIVRPDGLPWALRYWDPRVVWHLPSVIPPMLWHKLQKTLGEWWTLDAFNQLVTYSAPVSVAGLAPPEALASMRIEPPVWDRLARIGWTNSVLRLAGGWGVIPTAQNADRVERLIARCESLGFTSEQDVMVFAACGLTSHDRFDEHPQVAAALKQSHADGQSVQSAIASFNEEFWSEIASSRWRDEASRVRPT